MSNSNTNVQEILEYFSSPYNVLMYSSLVTILCNLQNNERDNGIGNRNVDENDIHNDLNNNSHLEEGPTIRLKTN